MIDIDTVKLSEQVNIIKDSKVRLEELFGVLKNDNNILKEMWETRTSEGVFDSFEEFYKDVKKIINNLNKDVEFLEKVVNSGYIENVAKTNEQIDNNIAL